MIYELIWKCHCPGVPDWGDPELRFNLPPDQLHGDRWSNVQPVHHEVGHRCRRFYEDPGQISTVFLAYLLYFMSNSLHYGPKYSKFNILLTTAFLSRDLCYLPFIDYTKCGNYTSLLWSESYKKYTHSYLLRKYCCVLMTMLSIAATIAYDFLTSFWGYKF